MSDARRSTVSSRGPSTARPPGLGDIACPSTTPACCAPHHTISKVGVIGGGQRPMPGEVSLAHHGLLLLDERPACTRQVLEVLGQPLEKGVI
jgi:predicted ATPase with chaperone activity